MHKQVIAIIEREGDGYVALCPELDIASQGATVEEARCNLSEALELFHLRLRGGDQKSFARRSVYSPGGGLHWVGSTLIPSNS
jgi:predicted RNase H-like HicB family nuclease